MATPEAPPDPRFSVPGAQQQELPLQTPAKRKRKKTKKLKAKAKKRNGKAKHVKITKRKKR
jgi:hypothetical protein